MKYLILILTFSISFCFGQTNEHSKEKPKSLEETYPLLENIFDDTVAYNFMLLPEDVAVSRLHFPFGMWIRNEWGLWKDSELKVYFNKYGVYHPDAMSTIIFTSYYRHLHNKPIDLKAQIDRIERINSNIRVDTLANGTVQYSYPELMRGRTTNDELLKYYPIGDTVLISLDGNRGFFKKIVTFNGVAKISGHTNNKLLLTIVDLKKDDKVKSKYKIGDEIDAWMASCTLIPPKNWKK